jgi:tetratricopeptide (TPR) repeat protein
MKNKMRLFVTLIFILITGVMFAPAQTTPQTHDEFVQAGKEAVAKSDFNSAVKWYSKAIDIRLGDYEIIFARAGCYAVLQKYDNALKDVEIVAKQHPENIAVLHFRATIYNVKKEWKKTMADAETILRLDPNNAKGYQVRGGAFAGQKKYVEAEDDLTKAITLDPKDHVNYILRGALYEAQGMAGKAQADKLKAEQLQRGN